MLCCTLNENIKIVKLNIKDLFVRHISGGKRPLHILSQPSYFKIVISLTTALCRVPPPPSRPLRIRATISPVQLLPCIVNASTFPHCKVEINRILNTSSLGKFYDLIQLHLKSYLNVLAISKNENISQNDVLLVRKKFIGYRQLGFHLTIEIYYAIDIYYT